MAEEEQKSSEQVEADSGSAQQQDDIDALAADEETSPADELEQGVPIAKHAALRQRAQQAEIARARAEGELAALREQQTRQAPASAKSPLDLEIERQAAMGIDEEDMTISPKVIKANDIYNQQVANQKAEKAAREELAAKQTASAHKAMTIYPDWSQVVQAADGLLTQGELLDITRAGDNFGEIAYEKAQAALARNKKPEPNTSTAPEKKQSKSEAEKAKVPTRQEILDSISADPQTIAAAQL